MQTLILQLSSLSFSSILMYLYNYEELIKSCLYKLNVAKIYCFEALFEFVPQGGFLLQLEEHPTLKQAQQRRIY